MVLQVADDGSMHVNLGCISADMPMLAIDANGSFTTPITAYYSFPSPSPSVLPGDQSFQGTLTGQVNGSGNQLTLTAVLTPPNPRPNTPPDTYTDVLNRGQAGPSEPLLCAMHP